MGSNLIEAKAERKSARFRRLFPEWLTRSDLIEVPDWRVVGAKPAYEAKDLALLKILPNISAMMIAAVLTATPDKEVWTG